MVNESPARRAPEFDPESSVFVSANAGSGKTTLLTRRVLSLLLSGVAPSRILCLTYTKAAATEMTERVQRELGKWVMLDEPALAESVGKLMGGTPSGPVLKRARGLFAAVLDAPEGVRVQTVHSFCQSLLRRFPLEAGISPHFALMDDRSEQELLKEARQRLFLRAQHGDGGLRAALAALACTVSESTLHQLLGEMLGHRRRLRALLAQGSELPRQRIWEVLGVSSDDTLEALMERHFHYDADTLEGLRRIADCMLSGGGATDGRLGACLSEWLVAGAGAHRQEAYFELFMTRDGKRRGKPATKAAKLTQQYHELLLAEQERAFQFAQTRNALAVAQATSELLYVTEALLSIYDSLKQTRALMDYDDLILNALTLLQKPGIAPWVLFKLDGGLDHILVDEAQDTSPEQWAIVKMLSDEFFAGYGQSREARSIFVVGDEKQSIYSFQGAQPAQLGVMRGEFSRRIESAGCRLHDVSLIESYRSAPEVLQAVDAVFQQPLARAGLTLSGEVPRHAATVPFHGAVEWWPVLQRDPQESEESPALATQLARQIARAIQGWLTQGVRLESKGRALEAGDILILLQRRAPLADRLVRALKAHRVPVAGQDRMSLSDNLAVQDLIACARVLLLPEDDLALAGLLKSPIFGFSEDDLFHLAWNRGRATLWERLGERAGERPVYSQAYALLFELRSRVDYVAPFELFTYLLDEEGARRRITGRMGDEYAEAMDEFLAQALDYERMHAASLQGFVSWLTASDREIKRDPEQAGGSVRILTVHSAKGLQAPLVIIPEMQPRPSLKGNLNWHDDEGRMLPIWPPDVKQSDAFSAGLREMRKQARAEEDRRLLYVALTRAEERLYICGASSRTPSPDSWHAMVEGGLLLAGAQPCDTPTGHGLRLGAAPEAQLRSVTREAAAATTDWSFLQRNAPAEPSPPQPLAPSRLSGDEPPAVSPLRDAALFTRGRLIHALLQYLPEIPPEERAQYALRLAVRHAADMPPLDMNIAIAEVMAVMENPESAFLFAPGGLAEVPLAGCVSVAGRQVAVAGQIDRLHVGPWDVWAIDYKSNRRAPASASEAPTAYLRQMKLYQLLLQRIYPVKNIRCALLWTATATLMPLPEALLDEVPSSFYIQD